MRCVACSWGQRLHPSITTLYATHPSPADEVNGSHRKRRLLSLPSTTAEPHREALLPITALAPNVHLPTEQSVRSSAAVYRGGAALARPTQDEGNTTAPGKPVRRLPSRLTNPTPRPAQRPELSLAEVRSVWPFAGVCGCVRSSAVQSLDLQQLHLPSTCYMWSQRK